MKIFLVFHLSMILAVADAGLRFKAGRTRNIYASPGWKAFQETSDTSQVVNLLQKEEQVLEDEQASIAEMVEVLEASAAGMSLVPTDSPTNAPFSVSSNTPSVSSMPSDKPSPSPTQVASTSSPTLSSAPSVGPTVAPTASPTLEECGITPADRETAILGILDQVADSARIRDISTPQGLATQWIINGDPRLACPDDTKIVQRWVLAVMYYSTTGDAWFDCFAGDQTCTNSLSFLGEDAFLSESNECQWAGISCNFNACVTEIEFEENNLVGTIPTELGLLDDLVIWGMERGNLTSTIPSEIGRLGNLIFIDLDFNELTGTIPTELYTLTNLTQLDLNNNLLEGNVDGIGVFSDLEFLQLHSNRFNGTIPAEVGDFSFLSTFTLHENDFEGSVPAGLCNLVANGTMESLIADCAGDPAKIDCTCCTDCRPIFI